MLHTEGGTADHPIVAASLTVSEDGGVCVVCSDIDNMMNDIDSCLLVIHPKVSVLRSLGEPLDTVDVVVLNRYGDKPEARGCISDILNNFDYVFAVFLYDMEAQSIYGPPYVIKTETGDLAYCQ